MMKKTDENRRSYTLLSRKPKPGNADGADCGNDKPPRLHIRKDGQPVTSNQVYAVVCRFPDMFIKAEGRIMLMI